MTKSNKGCGLGKGGQNPLPWEVAIALIGEW